MYGSLSVLDDFVREGSRSRGKAPKNAEGYTCELIIVLREHFVCRPKPFRATPCVHGSTPKGSSATFFDCGYDQNAQDLALVLPMTAATEGASHA